ncbi:D-alanine--D-alanine ligase [Chitiniphilus shinanonensis]|uniref:D-alanine--D-alanine ligase n=1 Tax=Chitiniphilus shinanonensis TaxID=553088 RepID=A0ABQ6BU50_9NEIS|nr:D-alanine--D-alanine ligase [Chitiniphilus shinanonensis]GLS04076.1 D-alanine--D-alanine ligase [Chitiniphilus shinanonensis]
MDLQQKYGKVAVLMGGSSSEREVSLMSGNGVLQALRSQGVDAHAFDPAEQPLTDLVEQGYDRAFLILHGGEGEDGTIQGALEYLGVPYTGCGVMASAISMDKWRTKLMWQALGLPVPAYLLLDARSDFDAVIPKLGSPVFVKPSNGGSSVGVTKCRSAAEIRAAYEEAAKYDPLVMVEQAITGGEYSCAVLDGQALATVKIEPATDFYDYDAKYFRDDTVYRCPGLTGEAELRARQLSEVAYRVLGAEGWARIDFLADEKGGIYLLEPNTAPGMTSHSLFPMCAREAGISYEQLVLRILDTTL